MRSPWVTRSLIGICSACFGGMAWQDQSIWMIHPKILWHWGARHNFLFALEEPWRLLTAIFLHGGILHFAVNMVSLRVLGNFFEPRLPRMWFLGIFLLAGIWGNVAGVYWGQAGDPIFGVGASGSLFGFLGFGWIWERRWELWGREVGWREGPFGRLILLNLFLSVGFNLIGQWGHFSVVIDNAAHTGGVIAGGILGESLLRWNLYQKSHRMAVMGLWSLFSVLTVLVLLKGLPNLLPLPS